MGDRFYQQQLNRLGTCPGSRKPKKRAKRMAWDDDKKQQAIDAYEAADPTPETSMDIVKEIAEDLDESPNGVRMILTKAGVYIKKAAGGASGGGEKSSTPRVSKAAAQEALTDALTDLGAEIDEDIISRLTGKAAQYFTKVLESAKD